jgi:hypothetical protein
MPSSSFYILSDKEYVIYLYFSNLHSFYSPSIRERKRVSLLLIHAADPFNGGKFTGIGIALGGIPFA